MSGVARSGRLGALVLAALLGGCAMPGWVPFVGKPAPRRGDAAVARRPEADAPARPRPAAEEAPPRTLPLDDTVADRVVAIVNNDAITLGELQESIVGFRRENRQASISDEEIAKEFLARLIDTRLQLQEADRDKVVVEDSEVEEELADRIKKLPGVLSRQDFEEMLKAQGMTMESVKKRLRESLRQAKIIRRKVTLRVSVTDQEIDRYLEQNRAKLETGLAYHARHILIVPEESGDRDVAWEAARIKAELLRSQVQAGADFAELAKQHSRDATARDGGDLGTLKRGELAADIEAEILKLQPGEMSPPFRSSLGYHLFRLETKESLEGDGLVRARQQIRDILFREKYDARLDAWLKEMKQRAVIEVRM